MKVIKEHKLANPISLRKGEGIEVTHNLINDATGEIVKSTKLISATMDKEMTVDTALIFGIDKGDIMKTVEEGIGGAVVRTKK